MPYACTGLLQRAATFMLGCLMWLMAMFAPAQAVELPAPARVLLQFLEMTLDMQPKVGSVRSEGEDIVLTDVVLTEVRQAGEPTMLVKAAEIRLSAAAVQDDLMQYRQIAVRNLVIDLSADDAASTNRILVPSMLLVRASILPEDKAVTPPEKLAASQLLAESMSIPEVRFEFSGYPAFAWRDIKGTWQGDRRSGAGIGKIDLGHAKVPLLDMTKSHVLQRDLQAIGLATVTFSGALEGAIRWLPDQRILTSSSLRLRVEEAGELHLTINDWAIPWVLLQHSKNIVQRELGTPTKQGTPGAANKAVPQHPSGRPDMMSSQNMLNDPQLTAAMRGFTLVGLEILWRDFGLTRRSIAYKARNMGVEPEAFIAAVLQDAQKRWGTLLPAPLAQQVVQELGHFLRDPKSLRLSIRGAGGRPVQLVGLVMLLMMPQMLMNMVSIEVKANE